MDTHFTLTLPDGARVQVPNALQLITPYVLVEQGDWFEPDIRFVRQLLGPGQQAVDIGANHGLYTLAMAQAVGAGGRVWAFEPGSKVRHWLQASVALNDFQQVTVLDQALSDREGSAWLHAGEHSELNTLAGDRQPDSVGEQVQLTTLDAAAAQGAWGDIALLKMDAEGEEGHILQGGQDFFASQSPLVLYEVRAVHDLQLDLVRQFDAMGYASYRLVADLGLLVPYVQGEALDAYVLNLYACKPGRARQLARMGQLVMPDEAHALFADPAPPAVLDWQPRLAALPYARPWMARWRHACADGTGAVAVQALAAFACSLATSAPAAARWAAARHSLATLQRVVAHVPTAFHLASLARVASACGQRQLALHALSQLLVALDRDQNLDPALPFLAPIARFDAVDPRGELGRWLVAAALEGHERMIRHSSYFCGVPEELRRLEVIHSLGYGCPEMERRRTLMQQRFGAATQLASEVTAGVA